MVLGRLRAVAVAGGLFAAQLHAAAASAQPPSSIKEGAQSPAVYRSAMSAVGDCASFKSLLAMLPTANRFMRMAAASPLAAKSEYESRAEYSERIGSDLSTVVGDASRLHVTALVSKYWLSYDAERKQERLHFDVLAGLEENRVDIQLEWSTITTGTYLGSTALGAKRQVERRKQESLIVGLLFPRHVVEDAVYFPLSGSDAAALASGAGELHVLGELVSASSRRSGGSPTFSNPLDTRTTLYEVQLRPRCAYITLGRVTLDVWSYNGW